MEQNVETNIEKGTSRKKVFIILGVVAGFLIVVAAAFIAGRLLNGQLPGTAAFLPAGGGEGGGAMMVEMVPAPEMPTTQPEVTGNYVERKDNVIYIQTFSMEAGGAGGVIVSSSSEGSSEGAVTFSAGNTGPKVEVVVTNDTQVYVDATEPEFNPGGTVTKVQQILEPGDLDDLNNQAMLMVWGRKVGDRVIADIIVYTKPIMIQVP